MIEDYKKIKVDGWTIDNEAKILYNIMKTLEKDFPKWRFMIYQKPKEAKK